MVSHELSHNQKHLQETKSQHNCKKYFKSRIGTIHLVRTYVSWDFTGILQIFRVELVTQIIHVSHLFVISSVKQILQSLDSSERQFCCLFVFVTVEFFFLRTYEHILPSPKYANVRICRTPLSPAYILNG